jgi:hypothetical protein
MSTAESEVDALRTALAAEHASLYLLAAFSARTSAGALADALREAYDFHRAARDTLSARLADLGDPTPVGAAPAYDLPRGIDTAAGVSAAALAVEQSATIRYGDLVAATSGADRTRSIEWLGATAVRQLGFGGAPADLPGIS